MSINENLLLKDDIIILLDEDIEYDQEPPIRCCPFTYRNFCFIVYICSIFFILFGGIVFIAIWLLKSQ